MKKIVLGTAWLAMAILRPASADEVRTLPPPLYQQMKSGKKLLRVWINPKYDPAQGFTIGQVDSRVDEEGWTDAVGYLRGALGRLEFPQSPNTLTLSLVELNHPIRTPQEASSDGLTRGLVGVEGLVTDPSGTPMMAFLTRAKSETRNSPLDNRRAAIDQIALALSRELGDAFRKALEARAEAPPTSGAGVGKALLPPPPLDDPADIQGRLLRLDELKKQGLITADEYQAHKAKILSGS